MRRSFFIGFLLTSSFLVNGYAQDSLAQDVPVITEAFSSTSIWTLLEQAGGIRFPIYGILIIGLLLIFIKVFELIQDRKSQKKLEEFGFSTMNLEEIRNTINGSSGFMLSFIMAKLLNVFANNQNTDYLHDEISTYNQLKQDEFATFKQRIDFLSDTAGALGLLGTVWGMFLVFSTGSSEKETILIGMGVALMSTLLGLVVSIILNFFTTLTQGFFTKHLQKVIDKADELRFRLIEISIQK